jgi:DNA-binding transcriptional LysR family regulator
MDLRSVRYFVSVAEQLHFGRAAERMNVVQSAISQQIKRLEEELDTKLFERSWNELRLTEAGRQMLPECRRLLVQADKTVKVAKSVGAGIRGKINFAFVDNSISALIPSLVGEFKARRPDVELGLQALDRLEQTASLEDRLIDIGLMPPPVPPGDFHSEIVVSAPLAVALPRGHVLACKSSLSLRELSSEPFVMFPAAMHTRILEIILAACASASFIPRVAQEATPLHTLLALVGAGLGVTLVPRWVASESVRGVAFRDIDPETPAYELMFVWRRDNSNPALEGLRAAARIMERDVFEIEGTSDIGSASWANYPVSRLKMVEAGSY